MTSTSTGSAGLYRLKPWYTRRLSPLVDRLDKLDVTPNAVTLLGIGFGAAAGAVLAVATPGLSAGTAVAGLVCARLACANADGTLARRRPPKRFGAVMNELGDRSADLALLAGLLPHLGRLGPAVLLAATLPSWVALAISAAGGHRINGGPVGKTERCLLAIVAAATGWYAGIAWMLVVGGVLTAVVRLNTGWRELSGGSS